jgi:hypothetical protein
VLWTLRGFLQIEQVLLAPQTASISAKFAVLVHDAVTGNDD